MPNMTQEIAAVLNRHGVDSASNTPDFILAQYLVNCLNAFTQAAVHSAGMKSAGRKDPTVQEVENHYPDKKTSSHDAQK